MTLQHLRVFAAIAAAWSIDLAAQTSTFSSKVEAVRVDVLASEKGRPIRGLTASDFDVLDSGIRQQVDLASFEQIPLNVVLALDVSSSVSGARLENLRRAAGALLDGLRPGDQAAIVTFSHVVTVRAGLTGDFDRVREAVDRIDTSGETALIDGVYTAMMLGESDVGRALVIVFSDGLDTSSWLPADAVLDTARRSDVVVYGVRARGPRTKFLNELSELTGGGLLEADPAADMNATFTSILDEFRQRYLISYTPRDVDKSGWHQLEVRVRGRSAAVKARPGYLAN